MSTAGAKGKAHDATAATDQAGDGRPSLVDDARRGVEAARAKVELQQQHLAGAEAALAEAEEALAAAEAAAAQEAQG